MQKNSLTPFHLDSLSSASKDDIVSFLGTTPPFSLIPPEVLHDISLKMTMEFYPKGIRILRQNGPPCDALHLIKSGEVRVSTNRDFGQDDLPIDSRSTGQAFGFVSLLSGDKSRANVQATQDTVCYVLPRNDLLGLIDRYPVFRDFFRRSFFWNFIDESRVEMMSRGLPFGEGDRLLFTTPLRELITRPVVTSLSTGSIRDAASVMSRHGVSSVIILDEEDIPVGLVTDEDLREKVVARALDTRTPVSTVMSPLLIRAEAHEPAFEALLRMIRYNIHHLLVVESGNLAGIVTHHDFMMLQGTSPLNIAKGISSQSTLDGLHALGSQIRRLAVSMVRNGIKVGQASRLLSELREVLVHQLMDLLLAELSPAPAPVALAFFGSDGRREHTFAGPLDCLIVVGGTDASSLSPPLLGYLDRLYLRLRQELPACGFPPCSPMFDGGNAYDTPGGWSRRFLATLTAGSDAGREAVRILDLRHIWGDSRLTLELSNLIHLTLHVNVDALIRIAGHIPSPPGGMLREILPNWDLKIDPIDLKESAMSPLVEGIRVLAVLRGIRLLPTLDRIRQLAASDRVLTDMVDRLQPVYEFLLQIRFEEQIKAIESGTEPDNCLDPARLTRIGRRTLRDALNEISRFHDNLIKHLQHLVIAQ